jgi:hypothetical protein
MPKAVDLTGQTFWRLTVLRLADEQRGHDRRWLCRCSCGKEAVRARGELKRGEARSCGCLRVETTKARGEANRKHGAAGDHAESPEYRSWVEMRRRCSNPNFIGYAHYGGRGITVCRRWDDFAAFLADMGTKPSPAHSIDRINPDGHYEPGNCRWTTPKEQANNRRPRQKVDYPTGGQCRAEDWLFP